MKKIIGSITSLALVLAVALYLVTREAPGDYDESRSNFPHKKDSIESKKMSSDTKSGEATQSHSSESDREAEVDYADAVGYLDKLNSVTRAWREKRGYHLGEDFIGYQGPESYAGTHPHGYLGEEELKALAEKGDPDAQVLYAYYYLKLRDMEATVDLYREVVINTEQTAPLGSIAVTKLYLHEEKLANDPEALSEEQKVREENEAYAYFQLMKNRGDPMADKYLQTIEYGDFPNERRAEVERLAIELGESLQRSRIERGLPPYEDEPLDLAGKLGVSEEELKTMQERYSKTMEDEEFIEKYTATNATSAYSDQEDSQSETTDFSFDLESMQDLDSAKN